MNGKDGPRVDWVMSRANSSELRPDSRFLALYELDYADPALLEVEGINPSTLRPELGRVLTVRNITRESNTEPTFREFLSTEEQGDNVRADLTVPFIYDPQKKDSPRFTAKIGLNRFVRERSVRGRLFTYLTGSNAAPNDQAGVDFLSSGKVNSPEVIDGYRFNSAASQGYEVRDLTTAGQTVRNVDASTLLEAGYLMGTAKVGKIELMAGVRLEREERDFYIIPELNPAGVADATNLPEPIANDYALPAASLNWSFGKDDSHKLRLSYGKTVARPTFYEFAPIRIVDQGTGDDIRGNPELTDTLIDNFDLRWEWFPEPKEFAGLEMMAVSLFHKNLDSPIMTTRQGNLRSWQNFGSGTLQGIEFELQKRLFDDFTVSTNFTYIDSLVTPGLEQLNAGVSTASVFEGQPTYIYNFSLGYENKKLGLNANLVYNFTSEILDSITGDVFTPNVYKEPTHSLDLILSKKIRLGEVEGKLKFAAENLLDLEERKYYEGENVTFERYKRGRVFSIGISFDF
ncbi:MAG: TonB-dependent receptor [Verrucomicrobiales bacterium]